MTILSRFFLATFLTISFASLCWADEPTRIVFLAGKPSHSYGEHEHSAGCRLLADTIQRSTDGKVQCEVYQGGWPEDESVLQGADAIVMYCDGGGGHPALRHLETLDQLIKSGVGFVCIHYGVEVPKEPGGPEFLQWLGGYFEPHWSVNPHWEANYTSLPEHEVTRGVRPFRANDEWYFHMRFREGMDGVTPILTAVPPEHTMSRPDGPHSGNPAVRKEVAEGVPQHTAWVFERPDGGRSFGFTGGHFHWNWGREEILRLVSNAIVWTAKHEVPEGGLPVLRPSFERLEEGQDLKPPEKFDREDTKKKFKLSRGLDHKLRAHEELEATLAAQEPMLLSPTCLDVDHRGRVWLCEVVNYRAHRDKRPEGDRILILEDTDGDGVMDTRKVFYQGRDIDSAMGICVLGNKTIVSASPNIWIFTDENGDDIPDRKELLFSKTGNAQHDHAAHSFIFGPDGKLYWNFGNEGKSVHDASGNPVVDLAGNTVVDNGKPYYGGMVFRCNPDGSQLETLAHNFRNNYEVAVDAFGGMWQSDNDDDGHKATRINYLVDYGNYGYRDELTGAGWQVPRANLEATQPEQHWHLNDPGVVPTMLITGAGSPSGIAFYEGNLLPEVFRNQIIHCEPGSSVVRAYVTSASGAGYSATIENLLWKDGDDWFRPVDVCVAPDGSLFVADWYDPGVGGHLMGDLDGGRVYRIAPKNHRYEFAKPDFSTPAGAVAALSSPNQATRYLAWQAIGRFGKSAQPQLEQRVGHDDVRVRARVLWALGKLTGGGKNTVASALSDRDSDVRCMAIRLARQLNVPPTEYFVKVLNDPSPAVRRELAIALRFDRSSEMPSLWASLALSYQGGDRWFLEALGIGAERRWDECFKTYVARMNERKLPPHPDVVWRARTDEAIPFLVQTLTADNLPEDEARRMLRALDYFPEDARNGVVSAVVKNLLDPQSGDAEHWSEVRKSLLAQLLVRVPDGSKLSADPKVQSVVQSQLQNGLPRSLRLELLTRLDVPNSKHWLTELVCETGLDLPAIGAAQLLMDRLGSQPVRAVLHDRPEAQVVQIVEAFAAARPAVARSTLIALIKDELLPATARTLAAKGLARTPTGANDLLKMASDGQLPRESLALVGSALRTNKDAEISQRAHELFPPPKSKTSEHVPELVTLLPMRGDAARGAELYQKTATCAKCHPLDTSLKSIGPSLSEIGDKLAKEALYASILDPSAGISHSYETYSALTIDGQVITGLSISQTDAEVILRDAEGVDHQLARANLEEFKKLDQSLMPDNLVELLTVQELVDLVEYLSLLRK